MVRRGAIPLLDNEGAREWLTREISLALSPLGERGLTHEIYLALSPLGERVARAGAFFSRGGTGEGVGPSRAADSLESESLRYLLLASDPMPLNLITQTSQNDVCATPPSQQISSQTSIVAAMSMNLRDT